MILQQMAYNIKFFREQNGWTQEELAQKIHGSRSSIAKWENNSGTPDIEFLIKLCDIFNITLDQLVGRHSYKEDLLRDFKRIYRLDADTYDKNIVEIIEYTMTHPQFKNEVLRLKELPIKKQIFIHETLAFLINQQDKL